MKEKILEAFKALGFELEEVGAAYGFQYEGKNYLYIPNEEDEDFLNITLPAVLELEDEDDLCFYRVMDKINSTLKYVKANIFNDSMWLAYEREMLGGENLEQEISRMIIHLDAGVNFLRQLVASADDEEDAGTEVTDADTDIDEDVA